MKDNLKDILTNLNSEVDQDTLLLYLQGKLSHKQQHEVEMHLLNDDFEKEAMEGLQEVKNQQQVTGMVEQLNYELRTKTIKKKKSRKRSELKEDPWLWIALLIILLLVIICYIIIHKQLQAG